MAKINRYNKKGEAHGFWNWKAKFDSSFLSEGHCLNNEFVGHHISFYDKDQFNYKNGKLVGYTLLNYVNNSYTSLKGIQFIYKNEKTFGEYLSWK